MRTAQYFLLVILITSSSFTLAKTYRWVDADGNVVFSQMPPPADVTADEINIRQRLPEKRTDEAQQKLTDELVSDEDAKEDAELAADEQAKKDREAAIRQQNCKSAQRNLEVYSGPVVRKYKMPDGSLGRLDDNERERRIEEARAAIEEYCY